MDSPVEPTPDAPLKRPLDILIVEDTAADVVLMESALRKAGLAIRTRCVDNRHDFLRKLAEDRPDVILSDHGFPAFDGYTALAIARQRHPEIPFIFVTGALGEEIAIQAFERGANDYVLKTRLDALAPAVVRALKLADEQQRRAQLEAERRQLTLEVLSLVQKIKTLRGLLPICSSCKNIRDAQGKWRSIEEFLHDHLDVTFTHSVCPKCVQKLYPDFSPKVPSDPRT